MVQSMKSTNAKNNKTISNAPNAAKLMLALRHSDYDNLTAICDLIDNCIDAEATKIHINVLKSPKANKVDLIEIYDNGKGMDMETLVQAMKLGSETDKDLSYNLGKFGMGLITSSISLGKKLEVLTKSKNNPYMVAIQDIDEMVENNDFTQTFKGLDKNYPPIYSERINLLKCLNKGNSSNLNNITGTVVKITKLDKCDRINVAPFVTQIVSTLGQTFRKFIQSGKISITVNDCIVKAIDPIQDLNYEILCEVTINMKLRDIQSDVKITVYEILENGAEIDARLKINISSQGFYILRNNREICAGQTLGFFKVQSAFNHVRIEVEYSAELDELIQVNFSKQKITLSQEIRDKINDIVTPFLKQISKKYRGLSSKDVEDMNFDNIKQHITQCANMLALPPSDKEKRNPYLKHEPPIRHEPPKSDKTRKPVITQLGKMDASKIDFKFASLGELGPIFEPEKIKNMVIITWNIQHPFFVRLVKPYYNEPNVINPLAYYIYSLAVSELSAKLDSDEEHVFEVIRRQIGMNLALLLK